MKSKKYSMKISREQKNKLKKILLEASDNKPEVIMDYISEIDDDIEKVSLKIKSIEKGVEELKILSENIHKKKFSEVSTIINEKESILRKEISIFGVSVEAVEKKIIGILLDVEKKNEGEISEIKNLIEKLKKLMSEMNRKIVFLPGGLPPPRFFLSGTILSIKWIDVNYIPGSNISISTSDDDNNRRTNLTITASQNVLTATGNIDSVNSSFVFTSKPTIIVSDHAQYRENHGWTWNSSTLTATMTIPPSDDLWGII